VIKLAVKEEDSNVAHELWARWVDEEIEVVAPPFLWYEVTSVLRNKMHRSVLAPADAHEAFVALLATPVTTVSLPDIHARAWRLAERFDRPNAYDSNYLALSEALDCPLWTADRRLYNA